MATCLNKLTLSFLLQPLERFTGGFELRFERFVDVKSDSDLACLQGDRIAISKEQINICLLGVVQLHLRRC
ncbi:hypothetical protein CDZ97_23990 [Mameliella alba]|nr:hypothetical protein CDZ95_17810 [Mameliella alba]OWV54652.1 hypothetical protein CDZ97_23990 [Mameliella alba]